MTVFDVPMTNRRFEERIFTLQHIDRETAVNAIKMVIPRFDDTKHMIEVNRAD